MRDGSDMGNQDEHARMECSAMPLHDGLCLTSPQEMQWQGLSSQRRLSRHCVLATRRPGIDVGSVLSKACFAFWIARARWW